MANKRPCVWMWTLEDSFRVWAFHQAYRVYANEKDLLARFAKAIRYSSQPVPEGTAKRWRKTVDELRTLKYIPGIFTQEQRADYCRRIGQIIKKHMGVTVHFRPWELETVMNEMSLDDVTLEVVA